MRHQEPFCLVFGKTRPEIEPQSPGPLENTLTDGPVQSNTNNLYCFKYSYLIQITIWFQVTNNNLSNFNILNPNNSYSIIRYQVFLSNTILWRCPWCSRYRRRKWTRRHEFKSWTRLIAFHIALIPLGKV